MVTKKVGIQVYLVVILSLGFLTTGLFSFYVENDLLSTQIADVTLPLTSENIHSEIQRELLRPVFISSLMAQDTFLRDWILAGENEEREIINYLAEIQKKYSTISSFFVSEKTKKYYHYSGCLKKVSKNDPADKWYFDTKAIDKDYKINIDWDTADRDRLTVFVNHRVYDYSGNFIGVTGVGLSVIEVSKMIELYQNKHGRTVYFTDTNGNITLCSKMRGIEGGSIKTLEGSAALSDKILASDKSSLTYEKSGETVYLNSRFIPMFGWFLIIEQSNAAEVRRIINALVSNLFVSFLVLILVFLLVRTIISKHNRQLEELATTDKLTGLANRYVFDILSEQAVNYSQRRGIPLSFIMFDLDNFKQVNDKYGHAIGDSVLINSSGAVVDALRTADIVCRWGGEEFMIILTDCDIENALLVAEKLRSTIASVDTVINDSTGESINITASFGVGQITKDTVLKDFIHDIDVALYKSKEDGRNRVRQI